MTTKILGGDLPPVRISADAEIITLDDFRDGAAPKLRTLRAPSCFCALVFHKRERTVTCSRCGKVYEPFEALCFVAQNWDRYALNRDAIKGEVARLAAKKRTLIAELKALKVLVKRAKERGDST